MKLIALTLTALISLSTIKSNAQDVKLSAAVVNAFHTSFKTASDVQWKDCGSYCRANFMLTGQYVTAYYDQTAHLMAVTKNISTTQLPVTLQAKLKNEHEKEWVSDLFELSDESGTSYYVTLENSDTQTILKSVGTTWTTYKKSRKS